MRRIFNGIGQMSSSLGTSAGLVFLAIFFVCIVSVIVSWIVIPRLKWRRRTKSRFRRVSVWFMIGLYFLLILSCMYLLRDPSQGYQMQFLPLYGLAEHSLLQKELLCDVGTFLMFVLVGILFRAQYRGEWLVVCQRRKN